MFNQKSNVIQDFIGFATFRSVIGLQNSRLHLNQSDANLRPIRFGHSLFPALTASYIIMFSNSSHRFLVIFSISWSWEEVESGGSTFLNDNLMKHNPSLPLPAT